MASADSWDLIETIDPDALEASIERLEKALDGLRLATICAFQERLEAAVRVIDGLALVDEEGVSGVGDGRLALCLQVVAHGEVAYQQAVEAGGARVLADDGFILEVQIDLDDVGAGTWEDGMSLVRA